MTAVKYINASCIYPGNPVPAIDQLNLDIEDGEFMVLVGPSGSGKSTALRMVAGLEKVSSGQIQINGVDVGNQPPKDRDIAMVFQNYALYPHMSVAENMGWALKLKKVGKSDRDGKVREAARLLDLEQYLDRKPGALSGGQRQRVAMGRAIVREPSVFLMDEPLSNLDAKLRVETRANIAALQAKLGTTTIYVTHDQVEAMTMGHRVALLKDGTLQQVDTPRNLYDRPANAFVAGFIGSPAMNLKKVAMAANGCADFGGYDLPLRRETFSAAQAAGLDHILLGVRPESIHVVGAQQGLPLTVNLVEELGADAFVYGEITTSTGGLDRIAVRFDGRSAPRVGEVISVSVRSGEEHAFHPESGERLA
jgi:multiple sugar transport system ATP-binding protein